MHSLVATIAAKPAGGAALDQIVIATAMASVVTAGLFWLCLGHRSGRVPHLTRLANLSERVSGLPGWAALPSGVAAVFLQIALFGMYWDISLHIDQGRDPGPLANPAHYFILVGLFGVFAAGVLAISLPLGERPGRAAIRIRDDWYAPVGGVLMTACGGFALLGFPLDDMWHRMFGQDVTLWGPTHLMLIGGAGMSLIGQAILLAEGMRARPKGISAAAGAPGGRLGQVITPDRVTFLRRMGLSGGLLIGLSTFQAEFDFGVPQYRMIFQPVLIVLAAGIALCFARVWIGRGGAIGAALFFLALRGIISLLVGPVLGEVTPSLPLYLAEAACVELAAFMLLSRRPIGFGALSGVLIGTVGFASEWAWSQFAMPLRWQGDLLPEALILTVGVGVCAGMTGTLMGLAFRNKLPSVRLARAIPAITAVVVIGAFVDGLIVTTPKNATATVALHDVRGNASNRTAQATVRIHPASLAKDANWITITAWQHGPLQVDELKKIGPGLYATHKRVPLFRDWKSLVLLQKGRQVLASAVYMPSDPAIPVKGIPAVAHSTRPFVHDTKLLQREVKQGVAPWLWTTASLIVGLLSLAFLASLAWGVGRLGRRTGPGGEPPADSPAPSPPEPRFAGRPAAIGAD
jgi:hypothetical protein